jgi:hypothetical protein
MNPNNLTIKHLTINEPSLNILNFLMIKEKQSLKAFYD